MTLSVTEKSQIKDTIDSLPKQCYIYIYIYIYIIGNIVASFLAVAYGPLHYQHLERDKILGLKHH